MSLSVDHRSSAEAFGAFLFVFGVPLGHFCVSKLVCLFPLLLERDTCTLPEAIGVPPAAYFTRSVHSCSLPVYPKGRQLGVESQPTEAVVQDADW